VTALGSSPMGEVVFSDDVIGGLLKHAYHCGSNRLPMLIVGMGWCQTHLAAKLVLKFIEIKFGILNNF
jgi:hypothetical protein